MKTIVFNNNITKESAVSLIETIENKIPFDIIFIYFSVGKGLVDRSYVNIIIDYFNMIKNVSLIAFGELNTDGFEIFFKTNCVKKILTGTRASIKLYEYKEGLNNNEIKERNEDFLVWYKKIIPTDKELESLRSGKPVFYSAEQLQTILENHGTNLLK